VARWRERGLAQSADLAEDGLSDDADLEEAGLDSADGFDSDLDSLLVSLELPFELDAFSEDSDALFFPLFA